MPAVYSGSRWQKFGDEEACADGEEGRDEVGRVYRGGELGRYAAFVKPMSNTAFEGATVLLESNATGNGFSNRKLLGNLNFRFFQMFAQMPIVKKCGVCAKKQR